MGTWGTSIASNDGYADIYSEFQELYNDGMDVPEITEKLIAENWEMTENPHDANNFWFAIAKAQWEYKQLQSLILSRVTEIIESGADIESWRELDASEEDIEKRKVVLAKFLLQLNTEKPKPKVRKKTNIYIPGFEKGDCLTFKLENGNYGGAVVIEAEQITTIGINLIANTTINQQEKPSIRNFKEATVLILNHNNWSDKPHIKFISAPITKIADSFEMEKVGQIDVKKKYDFSTYSSKYPSGGFDFPMQANMQIESERIKPKPSLTITIKQLTKNSLWKFW